MKKSLLFILFAFNGLIALGQNITGQDFWFTIPTQTGGPYTDERHTIFIASDYSGTATITYTQRRPPYKGSADPNSIFTVNFTAGVTSVQVISNASNVNQTYVDKDAQTETVQPNGFHITSTQPIVVYALNDEAASSETSPVYPTVMLGTDYIVTAYRENTQWFTNAPSNFMSKLTVIGTQDNTNINIILPPKTATKTKAAGSTINVTLNAGNTYTLHAQMEDSTGWNGKKYTAPGTKWKGNNFRDMGGFTGTHIISDKPIAVIGGADCTQAGATEYYTYTPPPPSSPVTVNFCGACDIMFQELIPTTSWGTEFVAVQTMTRSFNVHSMMGNTRSMADYLEIVAQQAGTKVKFEGVGTEEGATMNGLDSITLGAYQRYRYEIPGDFNNQKKGETNVRITSNNPISVSQYMKGTGCDNIQFADPSAVHILPVTTWIDKYITTTPVGVFPTNYIIFIVKGSANTGTFVLDNVPVPNTGWTQIGNTGYYFKRMQVGAGTHKSYAAVPFGIVMSGAGNATSYSYEGGGPYLLLAVPLETLTFNAAKAESGVDLNWTLMAEKRFVKYEIEKSFHENAFTTIGQVIPGSENKFHFIDKNPEKGINYYRLKMTDENAQVSYSITRSVDFKSGKIFNLTSSYPNPSSDYFNIHYYSGSMEKVTVQIYDILGKEVLSHDYNPLNPGDSDIKLDISMLQTGVYTFKMIQKGAEDILLGKIVRQ